MGNNHGWQSISVLISDSTRMGCQLLSNVLKASRYKLNVSVSATTARDLLNYTRDHDLDVAVISASLQDGPLSGLKMLREVHCAHPEVALIVLLDTCDRDHVIEAFRAGASGI